jgi:hypothetical protein
MRSLASGVNGWQPKCKNYAQFGTRRQARENTAKSGRSPRRAGTRGGEL